MKPLLLALALFFPVAAAAASPEEAYLAARDQYIAAFKRAEDAGPPDDRLTRQEARARAELEKRLQGILGKVEVKGFPAPRKSNLQTLFAGEMGFGQLDGLNASTKDETARVLVTTEGLLKNWLGAHAAWWPNQENVPQEIGAALKSEAFYTQAMSSDAAVARFAELPVTRPAPATASYAMLALRRQDIGPGTPGEIIVAVVQGGRAFVLTAKVTAKITPIAACDEVWRQYEAKAAEAFAAYQASGLKDDKQFDAYTRLQEEGDAAFRRCFGERAGAEPFFAAVVKQAQALLDRLPAR